MITFEKESYLPRLRVATSKITADGQHGAADDVLERDIDAHQVHAAGQRHHHQRADERADHLAHAAGRRDAADISRRDGIQLEQRCRRWWWPTASRRRTGCPTSADSMPIEPKTT